MGQQPKFAKIASVFFFGGWLLYAAAFCLFLVGAVVWTDFILVNPTRSHTVALMVIGFAPILGIVLALVVELGSLLAGTILALLGYKLFERLPSWYLLLMILVCSVMSVTYALYMASFLSEQPLLSSFQEYIYGIVVFALLQVPYVVGGCWWCRRIHASPPALQHVDLKK